MGGVRGGEGGMEAVCDVIAWLWQGQRSRCTQADAHQTQSFSLHDWIILTLVWQKVNICLPSSAVHMCVERSFLFQIYIESELQFNLSHLFLNFSISLWGGKYVCFCSSSSMTVRFEQISHTFVFAEVVLRSSSQIPRFCHPAVVSVYISMPIRCVHMLSGCSAISGHWTLSHLVAVWSYDMENEILEPSPWAWRSVCNTNIVFLVLQICEFVHRRHKYLTNGFTSATSLWASSGNK